MFDWNETSAFKYKVLILLCTASGCIEEAFLINGPNPLPRTLMTASSSWNVNTSPEFAILHNTHTPGVHIGSWCPTDEDFEAGTSFIQVCIIDNQFGYDCSTNIGKPGTFVR